VSEPYDPNPSYWAPGNPGYSGPPPYQGPPYQGQPYQGQPDQGQPYQGQPYPATYPAQPYSAQPYQTPGAPVGAYGAPMYSIYPNPGANSWGRPGQVVAAAVLSYVEAGFLILTGLILFSGSSSVSDWSNDNDGSDLGWGAQFAFAGLGDILAAGLLIAGGVAFTSGRRLGRTLLAVGLGVCVVEAILWISWLNDSAGAILPWASFYLVMPIIATSMSYAGSISRWLANAHE
jgi:hypothetical protein